MAVITAQNHRNATSDSLAWRIPTLLRDFWSVRPDSIAVALSVIIDDCCGVLGILEEARVKPTIACVGNRWIFFVRCRSIVELSHQRQSAGLEHPTAVWHDASSTDLDSILDGDVLWIVEPEDCAGDCPAPEEILTALRQAKQNRRNE